jgi:hypothetical protein
MMLFPCSVVPVFLVLLIAVQIWGFKMNLIFPSILMCVILFAEPAQAKTCGSKLCCDTSVRDSNPVEVKVDQREGTKTSLLDPNVDGAYLDSVKPSIGGNSLDGANIFDDITGNNGELNHNESKYK